MAHTNSYLTHQKTLDIIRVETGPIAREMARLVDDCNEVDRVTRPICIFSLSLSAEEQKRGKKRNRKISTLSFPFHTTPYNSLMALGPHVSTPGSRILLSLSLARAPNSLAGPARMAISDGTFFFSFFPEFCYCQKKKREPSITKKKKKEKTGTVRYY